VYEFFIIPFSDAASDLISAALSYAIFIATGIILYFLVGKDRWIYLFRSIGRWSDEFIVNGEGLKIFAIMVLILVALFGGLWLISIKH